MHPVFFYLILLFTVIPVIEIYFLIQIGSVIGGFNTIAIIFFTGIIGAYFARSQGVMIWGKIQASLGKGELPAENLVHGLLIFAGGLLLITPGFVTDFFGFSLVLPQSRYFLFMILKKYLADRIKNVQFTQSNFHQGGFTYEKTSENPSKNAKSNATPNTNTIDVDGRDITDT